MTCSTRHLGDLNIIELREPIHHERRLFSLRRTLPLVQVALLLARFTSQVVLVDQHVGATAGWGCRVRLGSLSDGVGFLEGASEGFLKMSLLNFHCSRLQGGVKGSDSFLRIMELRVHGVLAESWWSDRVA